MELLDSSAAAGGLEAAEALFEAHMSDGPLAQGPGRALAYLERAVELGSVMAMRVLSDWLMRGEHVAEDRDRGRRLLERAADLGDAESQVALGYLLADTEAGEPTDLEAARHWFTLAAEQGNPDAEAWLGDCCRMGLVGPPDPESAENWYRRAAARQHLGAIIVLATSLEEASPLSPAADAERYALWQSAADMGDARGQRYVGLSHLAGRGCDRDETLGAEWLEAAAEQGDAAAAFELGRCYLNGIGVEADPASAKHWFQQAETAGHEGAGAAASRIRLRKNRPLAARGD